ncbi:MAG: M48 family metalloprotease [bacterium]|nr:M48 family metalloprotease [bacterium]
MSTLKFPINILFFVSITSPVFCQNTTQIDVINYDILENKGHINTIDLYYKKKALYKELELTNTGCHGYLLNAYYNQYLMIEESLRINYFITKTPLNKYLEDIVADIQDKNSTIFDVKTSYTVIIIRSNEVNAYCLGDRILAVSLGLLASLENEGELASVLCHELAHDVLEHHEKEMIHQALMFSKDSIGATINYTLDQGENTSTKMEAYLSRVFSENITENKKSEKEADSLSVLIYWASGYHHENAISAVNNIRVPILSKSKTSIYDYLISKGLVLKQNLIYTGDDSRMSDINNTHPIDTVSAYLGTNERMKFLNKIQLKKPSEIKVIDTLLFYNLRINSLVQIILSDYYSNDPALAVAYSILLKELCADQDFSDNLIIIGLCKGALLKEQLILNKCIGSTDPNYTLSHNQVIQLMQKLKLSEINGTICPLTNTLKKDEGNVYSYTAILYTAYYCFDNVKYNYLIKNYKELYKYSFFKNDLIYLPKKKRK